MYTAQNTSIYVEHVHGAVLLITLLSHIEAKKYIYEEMKC